MSPIFLAAALVDALAGLAGGLRVPACLDDHMVIKQQAMVPLWGWDTPGTKVRISSDFGAAAEAVAGEDGRWQALIQTPAGDAAPFSGHWIQFEGSATRKLSDVLIGEVWICSGQSNMEMPVGDVGPGYRGVKNWEEELKGASHAGIRLMDVRNTYATTPAADCVAEQLGGEGGSWHVCSGKTTKNFSAVGYFFGREVQKRLGVPVGLIGANWGGTAIAVWMDGETLSEVREYADAVLTLRDPVKLRATEEKNCVLLAEYQNNLLQKVEQDRKPGLRRKAEADLLMPALFEGPFGSLDGLFHCRRTITVPGMMAGKPLTMYTGPIDDMDVVFVDGKVVGSTLELGKWAVPRQYDIGALGAGEHLLEITVVDGAGAAGFAGAASDWRIETAEGRRIELSGNWHVTSGTDVRELPATPTFTRVAEWTPTALYNGMIAPLTPMRISGVIWYQGESNRSEPKLYAKLFPQLISGWRRAFSAGWGKDRDASQGFYFAEIAPHNYSDGNPLTLELREAQRAGLKLSDTGMANTMDVGNLADIHPNNKQAVGDRLARLALSNHYQLRGIETSGPTIESTELMADQSIVLHFSHTGTGLRGEAAGFDVAPPHAFFMPAKATIDGDRIVLQAAGMHQVKLVRYAMEELSEVHLWNSEGLPMEPFQVKVPWRAGQADDSPAPRQDNDGAGSGKDPKQVPPR